MPVISTTANLIAQLTRRCARCGRQVVVPPSMSRNTVRCGGCGQDIPPTRK